jgi:hypothetical protein
MFIHTAHRARSAKVGAPLAGLAVVGLLALTACGDDTTDAAVAATIKPTSSPTQPVTTDARPTEPNEASALEIAMADFGYGGIPDVITAGTGIRVRNDSETELHEIVAVRLPDGDDRPIAEIVDTDLDQLLSAGPPALVVLAEPGSDANIVPVGDGALHEPGRYLLICTIPTGVDPATYLKAAAESNGQKPDVDGGPPHFVHGMYADIEVIPA